MQKKKKKILVRIGSLRHGGAEKVLVSLLKKLPSDKYDIDLLLNLYSGKYLKDVPSWINVRYLIKGGMITTNRLQDIPIKAFRVIYFYLLKKYPQLLYKYILNGKVYDIEFAAIHSISEEIVNSPLKSSKKIVWIHNDISQNSYYTIDKVKAFFEFDAIMVISDKIVQYFVSLATSENEKKKVKRIYNPIDIDEIRLLASKNIDIEFSPCKNFMSIGTIYPQKGFDRLLMAHYQLLKEGYQHTITIIGDGYDFNNIKKLAHELHLNETVKFMGYIENPYPYMLKSDYYILASRNEGYPTVLFEALVLQKPIIATNVSGVSDILKNGELGYIIDNDEKSIYEGMKKFLEDPSIPEKYVDKIKNTDLPFTLENAVNKIENILDSL